MICQYKERGYEIKSWLQKHNNITRYVIVDDNNNMLESQQPYFVQTESNIGLTKHYHIRLFLRSTG